MTKIMYRNMNKIRAFTIIFLSILFIALLLQSCSGKKNDSQGSEKSDSAEAAEFYENGIEELKLRNFERARLLFEEAAKLQPDNSEYLNQAGVINLFLKNKNKSIKFFEQALKIDLEKYGEDHPKVATRRNNLGAAYQSIGEYEKAIEYLTLALDSDVKTYGEDHPKVAIGQSNLGTVYDFYGEYDKAIEYLTLALESNLNTYGEDHQNVASDRNSLGIVYKALGQYEKAIEYYEKALVTMKKLSRDDHPLTRAIQKNLKSAKDKLAEQNN